MTPQEQRVEEALASVVLYGSLLYPVGQDRAALCHAAVILAEETHRLRKELSSAMQIYAVEMARKDSEIQKWKDRSEGWAANHLEELDKRVGLDAEIAALSEQTRILGEYIKSNEYRWVTESNTGGA